MSFPRYPRYKDSGVEWLGEVPEQWSHSSLKWLARRYSGGTPDRTNEEYWLVGTIPWLGSGEVNQVLITEPTEFITEAGLANSSAKWVPAGALVMALAGQGKTKGMVAQLSIAATCNQSMAAIVPGDELDERFLFWWLTTNYQRIRNLSGGDLRDGLNLDLLGGIVCPLPSMGEQSLIAAFLDRETRKLDSLIAEQQRLIELLNEKRQAVISHAVTRGLDPDAPMKPSGVEWLGDVPAHWDVRRAKFLQRDIKAGPFGSALTKDMYVRAGYRIYGQEQVIANDFTVGDYYVSEDKYRELSQYTVLPDDILISCVGTFGKIALAPANLEPGIINPRLIRLRVTSQILGEYLVEVLRSHVTFEQFALYSRGGTMDIINIGTLSDIVVAVPPLIEQQNLLAFINDTTSTTGALVAEAERAIALLQERRSVLVSAAVTGKIDVRGLVQPEVEAA